MCITHHIIYFMLVKSGSSKKHMNTFHISITIGTTTVEKVEENVGKLENKQNFDFFLWKNILSSMLGGVTKPNFIIMIY